MHRPARFRCNVTDICGNGIQDNSLSGVIQLEKMYGGGQSQPPLEQLPVTNGQIVFFFF